MAAVSPIDKSEDEPFSGPPDVSGLTDAEVAERVARGEVNDFEARVGRTYWDIFTTNIFNIFNVTLFLLLLIVLIAQEYTTVLFAGFSVVGNSLIGTVQELLAKRRLEKLAQLAAQDVAVIRGGERITIPSRHIVKDDVIPITPGDRLAVDGRLIYRDALEIDESHLTGESEAVYKELDAPLYSGSFCVAGSGMMVATQVGRRSTVNRLAAQAKAYKNPLTPTQERIATLVRITLIVMFGFAPMLAVNGYLTEIGFLEIVKNAVVFVTSLVPQGLILVTIISLTIGAVKISRHQTLIQRVNAVESLANVTVLCFDKTGTITENRLGVEHIIPLHGTDKAAIQTGLRNYVANVSSHNSTVTAIAEHLRQSTASGEPPRKLREIPFTSGRKWGAIVLPDDTLILGAPERVLPDKDAEGAVEYFRRGMRVLAFARMPNPPDDGHLSPEIEPLALIVMRDQVRHDIHETLNAFREQNVKLKVISGDNIETVRAVSGLAGMPIDVAYTGTELDAMSDHELEEAVRRADVFARIEPDTKRRIVAALRRQGEYVAMVGDGVNDVPALKEANLAIVMNDGAQISKDVADIVLLNNAMSTLPRAFAEGTRITQTIFGTTKMFLTKNFYNTLLFICVGFMAMPFPISPIQISWSAFGTVNMPATLMALGILRPEKISQFRRDVLDYIVTAGVIGAAGMAFMYLCVLSYTQDLDEARGAITVAFLLYGLMIVWNVHGIDVMRPRTFIQFPLVAIFSTGLSAIVTIAATIFPETFDFYWPPAEVLVLVVAIHLLCMAMVSFAMRRRGFINSLWQMVEK